MYSIQSKIVIVCVSFLIAICAVSAEENVFGTKVLPGDSDIGRLIKNLPDGTTIGVWDIGLNPNFYDVEDIVYLDLPPIGKTNTNDIRLTAFSNNPAGSKVTPFDNDMGKDLASMNHPYIGFLNLGGSVLYDLEDPVYLHNPIISLATADKPGANSDTNSDTNSGTNSGKSVTSSDCDGFNSKPSYTEGCRNRVPTGASVIKYTDDGYKAVVPDKIADPKPNTIGKCGENSIEVIKGTKGYYYHIIGTDQFKVVSMNDALLLKRMDSLDESNAANTKGINTLTDAVNKISSFSQQTITNDVRLSSIRGSFAGTKVVDFNWDHNKLISPLILVTFPSDKNDLGALRYYDKNGNGQYDAPDDIYLDISFPGGNLNPVGFVAINDIRLTNGTFDQCS